MLRAVNWENEREEIKGFTDQISERLAANSSITALSESLKTTWSTLHKGSFFADPQITFVASEIEALLRHLSVSFSPGHDEDLVDFSRLSDGQKSMLYLSLVLSAQSIGRAVLAGDDDSFDLDKLRPPVFTIVALEEPENSLSPHYLGRIVDALVAMTSNEDAQALIATHAPSMLRRVNPVDIRYLRLTSERATKITRIRLPKQTNEAHKFVREAVQAYPEIYFSRLVILGEGDSEEIVLPRILRAKGVPVRRIRRDRRAAGWPPRQSLLAPALRPRNPAPYLARLGCRSTSRRLGKDQITQRSIGRIRSSQSASAELRDSCLELRKRQSPGLCHLLRGVGKPGRLLLLSDGP